MNFGPAYIDYLVEFYPENQIRAFWKEAGDALISRSTCLIQITKTGYKGQSSEGLALATPEEQQAFMSACKAAIDRIHGKTTVDPSQLGTSVNYSMQILQA